MRSQHFSHSRWLIVAPALVATVWSFVSPVSADPIPGLNATYYTIDEIPPLQSTTEYPVCGSEVENNINRSYDGEPYLDCTVDLFMVHMTGFITIPEHQTIEFWLASDDGGIINIGGNEWGNWWDQGCTATESGQIDIVAGSQPLDLWMYENGGGTCLMLAWNIDNTGWAMVPDDAFATDYQQPPDTTIPDTTIPETTTTSTTTTIPETTTTSTTTTTTSTTTTSTTTTTPQTIYIPPPEPTMPEPPATVPLPPTTMPSPQETQPEPPSTLPVALEPLLPFVPDTMPEPPATIPTIPLPPETIPPPPDTQPLPPDTAPDAPQAPETSEPAKDAELPPISDEAVIEALANIEQATVEEVKAIVTELLAFALTTDQAVSVASEPAVLEVLTNAEAEQVFEQVAVQELSADQAVELVAAVQDAPSSVRKAFEAVLNLFQGFADDYVMTNQTVPIKTRRALIALSAVFLVSAPAPIRRNK